MRYALRGKMKTYLDVECHLSACAALCPHLPMLVQMSANRAGALIIKHQRRSALRNPLGPGEKLRSGPSLRYDRTLGGCPPSACRRGLPMGRCGEGNERSDPAAEPASVQRDP
jgi:hypothetical protein